VDGRIEEAIIDEAGPVGRVFGGVWEVFGRVVGLTKWLQISEEEMLRREKKLEENLEELLELTAGIFGR
jgi:hypothetical protein